MTTDTLSPSASKCSYKHFKDLVYSYGLPGTDLKTELLEHAFLSQGVLVIAGNKSPMTGNFIRHEFRWKEGLPYCKTYDIARQVVPVEPAPPFIMPAFVMTEV